MTGKLEGIRMAAAAVAPTVGSKVARYTVWATFEANANAHRDTKHGVVVATRISTLSIAASSYGSWHYQLKSYIDDK
jgi:hypothetical protein